MGAARGGRLCRRDRGAGLGGHQRSGSAADVGGVGKPAHPRPLGGLAGHEARDGQIGRTVKHRGLKDETAGHGPGYCGWADHADHIAGQQGHRHRDVVEGLDLLQGLECLRCGDVSIVHFQRRHVGHVGGAGAEPHGVGIAAATLPAAQRRRLGAADQLGQVRDEGHPPAPLGGARRRQRRDEALHPFGHVGAGPLVGAGGPAAPLEPGADRDQRPEGREHGHERVPHHGQHEPGHNRQEDAGPRQGLGLRPGRWLRGHPQLDGRGRRTAAGRTVEGDPSRCGTQAGPHRRGGIVHWDPPLQAGGAQADGGADRHAGRAGHGATRHDRSVARAEVADHRTSAGPVHGHAGVAPRDGGVVEHHVATFRAPDHPGVGPRRDEVRAGSQAGGHDKRGAAARSVAVRVR